MNLTDYINSLDLNTNETLQIAKNCSTEQLMTNEENKWNVLQILEHIHKVDKICYKIISQPTSEQVSEKNQVLGNENIKQELVINRSKKIVAPDFLQPTGYFQDLLVFENAFVEFREMLKQNLILGKIVVDNKIFKHPIFGEMTISDWLYFIIHHTDRHLEQIKDRVLVG